MTGLAERIESSAYRAMEGNTRYAPFRNETEAREPVGRRSRFTGLGVIAAFLIFSGVTVAFARGQVEITEGYGVSPEAVLGVAWLLQGALALAGFVLAVKWLRS